MQALLSTMLDRADADAPKPAASPPTADSMPVAAPRRRAAIAVTACLFAAVGTIGSAYGQTAYPSKPIRLVIPFPPGGGGDFLARTVMGRAAKELAQPIVFENLSGAGGNIGSAAVARAAPDGYTLLYGTNGTLAINHTLYPNTGYDVHKNLQPISRLTQIGLVVVVRPGLPAATMPELLKLVRANPGRFTVGSAGSGTATHLTAEILKAQAGLSVVHIPYRGGAPAMIDLMGGQIDMMVDVQPSAVPHVRSGRVRALAVTTAKRSEALPDVPTVAESGVPGFDVTAWDAIMAPAGTPANVVAMLNSAIRTALSDPEVVGRLAGFGAAPSPTAADEMGRYLRSEIDRWGAAVKRSGAKVD